VFSKFGELTKNHHGLVSIQKTPKVIGFLHNKKPPVLASTEKVGERRNMTVEQQT
jgi:hypothetical protein